MKEQVLQIFYGQDCLPYKDRDRKTPYVMVGNSFVGSNDTTELRFYLDRIGGVINISWLLLAKLPDGTIVSQVLSNVGNDTIINEQYLKFDLSLLYTTHKGEITISLNGYQGNIEFETDQETGISTILGTPAIQVTGAFKFNVGYSPLVPQGKRFDVTDLQQIIGALSNKSNISDVIIVCMTRPLDLSGFVDGQIFYFKDERKFYLLSVGVDPISGEPTYDLDFYAILSPDGSGLVPYNGANDNVDLGAFGIKAKMFSTKNDLIKITENYGETDSQIEVKKGQNTIKWAFLEESTNEVHFASREWVETYCSELLVYATNTDIDNMFENENDNNE